MLTSLKEWWRERTSNLSRAAKRIELQIRYQLLKSFKFLKDHLYFLFLVTVMCLANPFRGPDGSVGERVWSMIFYLALLWAIGKGGKSGDRQYQEQQPKTINPRKFGILVEATVLILCSLLMKDRLGIWWLLAQKVWIITLFYRLIRLSTLILRIKKNSGEHLDKYLDELIAAAESRLYPERFPKGLPVSENSLSRTNTDFQEHLTERGLSTAEEDESQSVQTEN